MADARALSDGVAGGLAGAALGGLPSTAHAMAFTGRPLEAALAAGALALPGEQRRSRLLLAAVPVHLGVSLAWGLVLARALPRRRTVAAGMAAGLAIAALDLGVVGRRIPRVRALPTLPQVADHLLFGAVVGTVVRRRRACRTPRPGGDLPLRR